LEDKAHWRETTKREGTRKKRNKPLEKKGANKAVKERGKGKGNVYSLPAPLGMCGTFVLTNVRVR